MFLKDGEQFKLPEVEERVLTFWDDHQVFERSLKRRKGKKRFVFFEGPPTANGRPGIHHVIARVFKDVIPRYKTMQGFYVERKGGWDTHGLPVEIQVEKQLGLKSKKDIEAYGVAAFNKKCRESVWEFKEEFERLTKRMGYWLDTDHPYVTYETPYIESLWWILKEIDKKGYLVKGHKIVPWCPRCGTALSSHELAQGYEMVKDNSVYIKFKIKNSKLKIKEGNTYILSWTTTPWTLPGNVALAVGKNISYVVVEQNGQNLIVAKDLAAKVLGEDIKILQTLKGSDLVGLEYEPLFKVPALKNDKSYKIYAADFVTTTDGTGVVHTAVMYGADDYELGKKVGLPQHHTVDEAGRFMNDVKELAGEKAKDPETDKKIFAILEKNHNLFRVEKYEHEYPTCWRCHTPILYYARTSWFIEMSKLKSQLIKNNEKINWIPAHLKEGRFGEWLREIKDWNLSRERYWATPLPIWQCGKCHDKKVIGSLEELQKKAALPNIIFIRHGEAMHNVKGFTGPVKDTAQFTSHLTEKGKKEVEKSALALKKKKIDRIIASPLIRAQETAAILEAATGAPVETHPGLIDIDPGRFKTDKEFSRYLKNIATTLDLPTPGGESRNQVMARMVKTWKDIVKRYPNQTIVVVSHGDSLWMLKRALENVSDEHVAKLSYPHTGKIYDIKTQVVSLDDAGQLDLHRPFIDEVQLRCEKCEGTMSRIPEVADVWFDSGAMPYAQSHYPFEEKKKIDKGEAFPADYICEAIDQTRGWFYTLLAVSTLLGKGTPYKNVISLGLLNDKHGKKMSKSLGNIVDPWAMASTYGMDAVRWYFFTATPPGESKNFDEQEILKATRGYHLVLWNSCVFYKTYAPKNTNPGKAIGKKKSILDQWIVSRLQETVEIVTKKLDAYDVREAGLALETFLDDFSRWYIRRSRRRLQKPLSKTDQQAAAETMGQVLYTLASLTAPFTPFFAEHLYHELGVKKPTDSVHCLDWPKLNKKLIDKKLIAEMAEVRKLAAVVLGKRAELGIKVRQPLQSLTVKSRESKVKSQELLEILKDEVNIKEVIWDPKQKDEVVLDTVITPELRSEGIVRELIRGVQELRQQTKLEPRDQVHLSVTGPTELLSILSRHQKLIQQEVSARTLSLGGEISGTASAKVMIEKNELVVWLKKAS